MTREQIKRWLPFNVCGCHRKAVTFRHGWVCGICLVREQAYYADHPRVGRPQINSTRKKIMNDADKLPVETNPVAEAYAAFRASIEPELAAKRLPQLTDEDRGIFTNRHPPGWKRPKGGPCPAGERDAVERTALGLPPSARFKKFAKMKA